MKTKLFYLALASLAISTVSHQLSSLHAQGTAFTYQGLLKNGSKPATGNYDLTYTVYDAGAAGNLIAGPVTNAATVVSNGIFTTTIDFGPGVFTGRNYWLEIGVETNGAGGVFTVLGTRQPLTPTPYAIYSSAAGSAVTATTAETANGVSAGSVTGAGIAPGQVVTSLNNLADAITLSAGNNVSITPSGNTLTIAAANGGGSSIWSQLGNIAYYSAGNVGIGTSAPQTPLEVNGVLRSTRTGQPAQYLQLDGGDPFGIRLTAQSIVSAEKNLVIQNLSGEAVPGANNNIQFAVGPTASPSTKMTITKDGNVLMNPTGGGTISFGTPNFETGMSIGGANRADLRFDGSTFKMLVGPGGAIPPSGNGIAINSLGNVGMGTTTPGAKLEVVAQNALRLTGYQPYLTLLDNNAGNASSRIQAVAGSIVLEPDSFVNGSNPNNSLTIANSGNVSVKNITIRGGADVAEPFDFSAEKVTAGSVVIIDDEHPGNLKLSSRAYDTRVAGIISGANGVNPGLSLHQDGILNGSQNVALSGRVYVRADAAYGAIKPGDLLTTSMTPGHAMKVSNSGRAQGAILGKAMSGLKVGKGMVLVLVTLQ